MIRVLMVDDDPSLLELTRIFLERSGDVKVDTVESAAEALEMLDEERCPYEVIISDYAMPEMDGIAFLKAVRSRKLDLPFILFTGKSREEVVIEAINSGADNYMQKNGDPKVIFTELAHQIQQAADRERANKDDLIQRNLALKLSGVTSLSMALKLCVEAAIEVSGTDCGTMYLLDRASDNFALCHSIGFSSDFVDAISHRTRSPSTSQIARAKKPIYIRYQDGDLPLQEAREREGLRAMAVIPVHHEGEVIGYYSVGTHTLDEVPFSRRSALETIAAMTGNAIVRLQAEEVHRKTEERLRAIYEAAENVSFIITDVQYPEPLVLEFSPGAEKIFGYKRQEVVGKTVAPFHLPEDLAMYHEMHQQMMEGIRGFSGSSTLVRKSGEKFPAIFSTYPLSDEKGNTCSILGVSIDITNQKRMEEALQKSEEYYRAIFENCGTAMAIVEKDGVVSKVNSESETLLGFSPQEIEGKTRWDEFIAEEDRERLRQLFRTGQRKLKTTTAQYEADLVDRWGDTKRGLFRASIIPGTKQYVVSVMNVTEQKRMEGALKKSEEMYRTLVEDLTDLICRFLPDGTLTFANEAYCRCFGKDREELIGQCLMTLIPEEDRRIVWDHLAPLDKDHPVTTCVHRVIAADGKIRWQRWTDRAIFDGEGGVVEFRASGHDITDYKLALEALKESEERLKLGVEGANLGIWDWNLVTGEETLNEKWAEILGYSHQELEGRLGIWDRLVHPEDRENVKRACQDHLDGLTQHCETEHRMRSKDGRWVWIHGRGKVVSWDETGRPVRMTGVIQDINETRKFQEALKETNKKLNLLGSVTRHDLLNRISAIEGYAQILSEMVPSESAMQKCASDILDLAESARRQIAFTRDYQEVGVKAPRWQRVDMLAEMAASAVPLEGIRLKVETGPLEVFADPLIEKVFFNLMENSVRHGEKTANIRISFRDHDGFGVMLFEDDGVGVPVHLKERIFEQAFGRNTGYGLFLAREILGITGISIRETGLEGEGARFEINIPKERYRMDGRPPSG